MMDHIEDYFLSHNKLIEEKVDRCLHHIETRLDKLYQHEAQHDYDTSKSQTNTPNSNSSNSYLQFKAPYIKDFRNFSGPSNEDVRQINGLTGTENIDFLIKNKYWSRESKQQLRDAVLDYYAQLHIIDLIKQKNSLTKELEDTRAQEARQDILQKLSLIEEQCNQVRARKEQRIFVPENRQDPNVDWCSISAKLSNTHHDAQDCRLMWSNELHWAISDSLWTKDEDQCLLNAVQKHGKNDWDLVALELNSNRLPWQCCSRYQQEFLTTQNATIPITEDDTDKILEVINLCRIGNFVPWNQVMYFIQYHSLLQVKYQWQKLLRERKSNQPWSHQEDVLLLKTIESFGERDWNRIANYIPGRSNKSCRERYTMRLKFEKRSIGNWKRKEDDRLLHLIDLFGTNWSLIAAHFPERNGHQLRSRYELLKNESRRIGPIKHRKLYRNAEGHLVKLNRRQKLASETEVDAKLNEIFTTYQDINATSKSYICRSAQDEQIYQSLVQVIQSALSGRDSDQDLLSLVIKSVLEEKVVMKYELFPPSLPTIRGYKAWSLQQDYLGQFIGQNTETEAITTSSRYHQLLKIVISLFLWPAILSRFNAPVIDANSYRVGSIIEKDAKKLYKVRDIQMQIASPK